MLYAGAVGVRGRVEFSRAMVAGRAGSGAAVRGRFEGTDPGGGSRGRPGMAAGCRGGRAAAAMPGGALDAASTLRPGNSAPAGETIRVLMMAGFDSRIQSCPPGRAMPRLSAPSRRDCPPGSSSAARSARGCFPFLHRCLAAVARRSAPVPDASRGAEGGGEARPGALAGRVRRAAAVLVALVAIAFGAPALAQSLSVGINSNGTGDATGVEGDALTFTVKMSATKGSNVTLKWRFVPGTAGAPMGLTTTPKMAART